MKLRTIGLAVLLTVLIFALAGSSWAQDPIKKGMSWASKATSSTVGMIMPEKHFMKAHSDFMKKDMKASAEELRKAAESLRTYEKDAPEDSKQELTAAVDELESTAKGVEANEVMSPKRVSLTLANANAAVAKYHYSKASEYMTKQDEKMAGEELKRADKHLKEADKMLGEKMTKEEKSTMKEAQKMATGLIKGKKETAESMKKAMDDFQRDLNQTMTKIENARMMPEEKAMPAGKMKAEEKKTY